MLDKAYILLKAKSSSSITTITIVYKDATEEEHSIVLSRSDLTNQTEDNDDAYSIALDPIEITNCHDVLEYTITLQDINRTTTITDSVGYIEVNDQYFYIPNYIQNKWGITDPYFPIYVGSSDLACIKLTDSSDQMWLYAYAFPQNIILALSNDSTTLNIESDFEYYYFNYGGTGDRTLVDGVKIYVNNGDQFINYLVMFNLGDNIVTTNPRQSLSWVSNIADTNNYSFDIRDSSFFSVVSFDPPSSQEYNNLQFSLTVNERTFISNVYSFPPRTWYKIGVPLYGLSEDDSYNYDFKVWDSSSDPIVYYDLLPSNLVTSGTSVYLPNNNELFEFTGVNNGFTLIVNPTPADSTVIINGEQRTAYTGESGESVTIEVSHNGYNPYVTTTILTQDKTLDIELTPRASYSLTVIPTPEESTVLINGIETNTIIGEYEQLVTIEVSCEGYVTYTTEYTITENVILNISLEEERIESQLTVVTYPEEATVTINGQKTKEYTGYIGEDVTILVEAENYISSQIDLVLEETEVLKTVYLTPIKVQTATFTIIPEPEDADVIIDGQLQTSSTLPLGSIVTWQVSKKGYATQSGQITLNQDTILTVSLVSTKPVQEVFDYASYLANLLIIQYHDKPKAIQTIKALASMFPMDLIFAVRDGFNLETATGKQLDVLGKYIGVDRWYNNDGTYDQLADEEYRFLLKFKAISNTINMSYGEIDDALFNFFGNRVRATSKGNMEMTYFVPEDTTKLITVAIQKNVLPKPMGVKVSYIIEQKQDFYGFASYKNQYAVYKTGFRDYKNPTKAGEMFNYAKRLNV